MPAALVVSVAERDAELAAYFQTHGIGREHSLSRCAAHLACSDCRRDHRRARVPMNAGMNIVEIQRVSEDAVHESCFGHRGRDMRAPNGCVLGRTEATNVAESALAYFIEPSD